MYCRAEKLSPSKMQPLQIFLRILSHNLINRVVLIIVRGNICSHREHCEPAALLPVSTLLISFGMKKPIDHFVVIITGAVILHCHGEDVINARMLTWLFVNTRTGRTCQDLGLTVGKPNRACSYLNYNQWTTFHPRSMAQNTSLRYPY